MPKSYLILHDGDNVLVGAGGNSGIHPAPRPGIHLPGGTVNLSETIIQVALRECAEETGITITLPNPQPAAGTPFTGHISTSANQFPFFWMTINSFQSTITTTPPTLGPIHFVVILLYSMFPPLSAFSPLLLPYWQRPVPIPPRPNDEPFCAVCAMPFAHARDQFNLNPETNWFATGLQEARANHFI